MPYSLFLPLILFALALNLGCDGSGRPNGLDEEYEYRFEGVVVEDPGIGSTFTRIKVERNNSPYAGAVISQNDTNLTLTAGIYRLTTDEQEDVTLDTLHLEFTDPSEFSYSFQQVLSASFRIDASQTLPPIRQRFPGEPVTLTWFGAAGSEGYVIAAVKKDLAYTGRGYSRYVEAVEGTSATFHDSAFLDFSQIQPDIDTGLYYLYVYSFTGSPDSALAESHLPVPFPSQLDDNIDRRDFEGRMGTIVVTPYDSMFVVAEP